MAKKPRQVGTRGQSSRSAGLRHLKPVPATSRPGVPTFEEVTEALLSDRHRLAIARSAARMLADPTDEPSRANHAIALYQADRFAEAAPMFERLIEQLGPGAIDAVPLFFSLGYCRLQLGDPRGSLVATTTFLDRGNELNPLYLDGLENTAAAWDQLGAKLESRQLSQDVAWQRGVQEGLQGGRFPNMGAWPRRKVIETSFRVLGVKAKARRARRCKWLVD